MVLPPLVGAFTDYIASKAKIGLVLGVQISSLEALTIFQNQPDKFDLVITDQTMPGMTGSDLARRILQIRPFMPIILCTGYSSIITEEKAKSLGIKGFSQKAAGDLHQVNTELDKEVAERLVIETELSDMKNDLVDMRNDLSKSQAKEEESRKVALHDALTGLPNRILFEERLDHGLIQAKRHGWKLAVLFMDIDKFKNMNDSYGHDLGDKVLLTVGDRLQSAIRSEDTVSRWGGDEFVCLLLEVKLEADVIRLAELIVTRISEDFKFNGIVLSIKVSIGFAIYPADGEALEKHSRPVRNERKPISFVRQRPWLHAGRGQEHPGLSGWTCHRQPPAASTIDYCGTPRHRGQFLVRTWGLAWTRSARLICATFLCCAVLTFTPVVAQQLDGSEDNPVPAKAPDGKPELPGKVEVQPVAKDDEIRQRIANILKTTSWFGEPKVTVQEGIVIVGIGYDDSIPFAQEVALKVLADHPAVLKEPEPLVLVENLGPSTVNLRVYFWLDGGRHSWLKVKSSVIRLVKRAFQDSGISLPDEAREVTFPQGVPVRMIESQGAVESSVAKPTAEAATVATKAEAGLQSEAGEIKEQARRSWTPGENLLTSSSSADTR